MSGSLRLVTGPSIEPVTLAEALVQCRASVGVEDSWFTSAITAARIEAENTQRRAYITQTWDLIFDSLPDMPVSLPRPPLISVQGITIIDTDSVETVVPVADYYVDNATEPGRITFHLGKTWPVVNPRDIASVRIRYAAGYGNLAAAVPATVKRAILLYVGYMYENRAGEVPNMPDAFYNLLARDRMYQ